MATDPLAVAERLFAAIEAGDVAVITDELYDPDVVVWHNTDGKGQSAAENLAVLRWVTRNLGDLRYEEVRRSATPTGFVQQHVLRATAPDGTALEVPACLVVEVRNGRITRIDEYLDSAAVAALTA